MAVAAALLALVAAALAVQLVRSEMELRAIARFLTGRETRNNARVTLSVHTRGFVRLGQAINRLLDRHQGERIAAEEHRGDVRRGLTSLSHDIRTPLAGAQGFAQLIADEEDEALRGHYLDVVGRRLSDAQGLLEQFYAYAQAQDPDYRPLREPVDVNEVLAESLASLYAQFKERDWTPVIEFEDEALAVCADPDALARIFRNLTANALCHGSEAPRIAQRGASVSFSNRVENPGEVDTARLFERFYQGSAARTERGSGLGLAIVAQLAQAMKVGVDAQLAGDTLRITLDFSGVLERVQPAAI